MLENENRFVRGRFIRGFQFFFKKLNRIEVRPVLRFAVFGRNRDKLVSVALVSGVRFNAEDRFPSLASAAVEFVIPHANKRVRAGL